MEECIDVHSSVLTIKVWQISRNFDDAQFTMAIPRICMIWQFGAYTCNCLYHSKTLEFTPTDTLVVHARFNWPTVWPLLVSGRLLLITYVVHGFQNRWIGIFSFTEAVTILTCTSHVLFPPPALSRAVARCMAQLLLYKGSPRASKIVKLFCVDVNFRRTSHALQNVVLRHRKDELILIVQNCLIQSLKFPWHWRSFFCKLVILFVPL